MAAGLPNGGLALRGTTTFTRLEDEVLKFRTLAFTIAAATLTIALAAGSVFTAAPAGASTPDAGSIEQDFIARINGVRASQGLNQLAADSAQLTDVARAWAATMADAGSISHRPDLVAVAPSTWTRLGENVGVGPDAETIHNAFVASPGHYKNLVDPSFTTVAVGVVVRDGRIYVTENFMASSAPAPAAAAAAPSDPAAAAADVQPATITKVTRTCKAGKCRVVTVTVRKAPAKRVAVKRVAVKQVAIKQVVRHR
jgi:uncharacterized protein YkwD